MTYIVFLSRMKTETGLIFIVTHRQNMISDAKMNKDKI